MEGKPHSSKSYSTAGRMSRMKQDLLSCSKDLKSSFQQRTAIRARSASLSSAGATERPHVGVVGAGLAGLRCAEILISEGVKVTILEARDRLGGRIHQSSLLGRAVDMGPNWIHGTDSNPIVKLARETNTTLRLIDDTTCVFDPHGLPISKEKATGGFEIVWSMISDAFKYSNEDCANIAPTLSLKDFFREKLAEQTLCSDDQDLILLLAEMWGSFIGDPWERQSLKWFWLEECLDGDNLYVAESHEAILRSVAESALTNADIHLSTTVKSIENKSSKGGDPKVVVGTDDRNFEFDEVVVAVPLGCLKRGTPTLTPSVPPRISRAIRNASYSCLEKVYIAFPVAFWDAPTPEAQSAETKSPTTASTFPSFVHFLHPTYVPEQQKSWTLELVPLSSPILFGNQAQATLLFYMYGPCATHVTSLIRPFSPTSTEYINAIDEFFRPYYSLLPNYKVCHPDCAPSAVLATDWQNDDLAGNGSYTNFQISDEIGEGEEEVLLDEDVRVLREGLPERGIWFAGEHTAPFVALGTSTGAYWSGESAGMRILGANGLLQKYSAINNTPSVTNRTVC